MLCAAHGWNMGVGQGHPLIVTVYNPGARGP